jgi:small subunit ribosomal protein S1
MEPMSHIYKVTKYDPEDFGIGGYIGPEDSDNDRGPVEAAYLRAVERFAEAAGVQRLAVRDAEFSDRGRVRGVARSPDPLAGVLPGGIDGLVDGVDVSLDCAVELARLVLRDKIWLRLEHGDQFFVHFGGDLYMYIGSDQPCDAAAAAVRESGLFPELIDSSPYDPPVDSEPLETQPADDDFWAGVEELARQHAAVMLEEERVQNSQRWHRVLPGAASAIRKRVSPGTRLTVWPDLEGTSDALVEATQSDFPGGVLIWQDPDGVVSWADIEPEDAENEDRERDEVLEWVRGAARAAFRTNDVGSWLDPATDPFSPYRVGVVPDSDGIVRARWFKHTE